MTSRLTIDLDALAHNYGVLRGVAETAQVAPVIKADGYGLGAGPVARRLWAEGARTFFVARLEEGEALRSALADRAATLMVLDGAPEGTGKRLAAAHLTPVLNTLEQARAWAGPPAPLHVDTGMNRQGVAPSEALDLAAAGFKPSLIMSHLGSAADPDDPRNGAQLARFAPVRAAFAGAPASLSASSGLFLGPAFRFDMVRPGISLFGGGPRDVSDPRLKAVATLTAPVLQVRALKAGEQAGYGQTFTAPRDMTIAILGCGYADGVIRASHRGGAAWIDGRTAPFVFVTMDLIAADVSDNPRVSPGAEAELLGEHAKLDDLAIAAGSVAHECLVRLGSRSARTYRGALA